MEDAGLVMPVLQERFDDRLGLIGWVDSFWPGLRSIGEFDGIAKLTDPADTAPGARGREAPRGPPPDERPPPRGDPRLWEVLGRPNALPALLLAAAVPRR